MVDVVQDKWVWGAAKLGAGRIYNLVFTICGWRQGVCKLMQ